MEIFMKGNMFKEKNMEREFRLQEMKNMMVILKITIDQEKVFLKTNWEQLKDNSFKIN